jgi:hypothetical protein
MYLEPIYPVRVETKSPLNLFRTHNDLFAFRAFLSKLAKYCLDFRHRKPLVTGNLRQKRRFLRHFAPWNQQVTKVVSRLAEGLNVVESVG